MNFEECLMTLGQGDILPELKSADSGDKLPQSPFFDPEFLIFENFTGIIRALSEE